MATDNNIKNYSAADIEKYHKGLLSPQERHGLEKAALDDPFLADALEGYAVEGVDHTADIIDLKKRLAEKVESSKVIVMKGGGKTSFPWLRVAALIVIVAGAGLLAQRLFFTNQSKDIAEAGIKKPGETKINDTANTAAITSATDTTKTGSGSFDNTLNQNNGSIVSAPKDNTNTPVNKISKEANRQGEVKPTYLTTTSNASQPVATAPLKIEDEKIKQIKAPAGNTDKKEIAREEIKTRLDTGNRQFYAKDADGIRDQADESSKRGYDNQKNKPVAASRKAEDQNYRNQAVNTFRGRVTDANNVGLPFARVYNPADNNAGTYTDVAGNFNLTYPDSVLTVQVKSVGFENTNVQLRNSVPNNQVILQDDRSLSEVVISNQRPNAAARSREANKTLEEPEPADGWDNYDTYLTNNLNVPEEIKTKQNSAGQVQLSFEVDKNGEPVNIKIEKSLCPKCDEEAKRLIKEGPKWKRNAKKGRTTVTVPFNNLL